MNQPNTKILKKTMTSAGLLTTTQIWAQALGEEMKLKRIQFGFQIKKFTMSF